MLPAVKVIWLRLIAVMSDIQGFTSRHTGVYTCSFDVDGVHLCIVKCWPDEVMLCYAMPGNGRRRICHFYAGEEVNYKLIEDTIISCAARIMSRDSNLHSVSGSASDFSIFNQTTITK